MNLWHGHRTAWVRMQFCVGVYCAYQMISALSEWHTFIAAVNVLGMYITTQWKLPPPI